MPLEATERLPRQARSLGPQPDWGRRPLCQTQSQEMDKCLALEFLVPPGFIEMTLRVRRVKVPPEELDLQLKTTAPALPWGGGWVPRPGAQHFAPLLKSCSIPGGPFYGVLPIATVRQSRLVSSLKPSCCCCFGAMPLALEMERKRTPSQWPKSFL